MKICPNCAASNSSSARFCNECGVTLDGTRASAVAAPPATVAPSVGGIDHGAFVKTLTARASELQSKRKADILFVLDCTGSMQGEINAIRDAILSFADSIKSDGVRVRVGLIEFRDRLINEEARVLKPGGQTFTQDPELFRREVSALRASGGGDAPESSLDAVMLALRQDFEPDTNKVIVLITDAPPHVPDKEVRSVEEVVEAVRAAGIQQFYVVMRVKDPASQVYLKLLEGTRGLAFDLGTGDDFRGRAESFRRTLMSLGKTISISTR